MCRCPGSLHENQFQEKEQLDSLGNWAPKQDEDGQKDSFDLLTQP